MIHDNDITDVVLPHQTRRFYHGCRALRTNDVRVAEFADRHGTSLALERPQSIIEQPAQARLILVKARAASQP
jgi:hypothetical protein